jgi:hypothetical protein
MPLRNSGTMMRNQLASRQDWTPLQEDALCRDLVIAYYYDMCVTSCVVHAWIDDV